MMRKMNPMSVLRFPTNRRHVLATLLFAGASLSAPSVAYAAKNSPIATGAPALVRSFAAEGVSLLEDQTASPIARADRFRSLLQKYFATDAIARWVLGRYWNQLDAQQSAEYRRLFEDLVVYGYVKRFGEYTGERLRIVRTVVDSDRQATVFSEIERPGGGARSVSIGGSAVAMTSSLSPTSSSRMSRSARRGVRTFLRRCSRGAVRRRCSTRCGPERRSCAPISACPVRHDPPIASSDRTP
ncbi:MAG: ABC transporter substrate-binding protein [Rhodospirillales bacterium]|nr:ABC transporter substrate-binding protein [Rhodospirillales bacterium]